MAQSIKNLELGSKVIDSKGNKFVVVARNHYSANEVTLLSENSVAHMKMNLQATLNLKYPDTEVSYYLNNTYLNELDANLVNNIKVTKLPYVYQPSYNSLAMPAKINIKAFVLSASELGFFADYNYNGAEGGKLQYVVDNIKTLYEGFYWTRTSYITSKNYSEYYVVSGKNIYSSALNGDQHVLPAFNVDSSILVSDNVDNGYYSLIFNNPPVIQNIVNIQGNYGSTTNIVYTATDSDDADLTHYISFNNGDSWTQITPKRVGDTYTYAHVFSELNEYTTRIKVVDSAKNEAVSNLFVIYVNASSPTINIVSVVDRVITFKVNCVTHDISKVEILVNGKSVKTYNSGFDFNLVYEVDRTLLNIGKNAIQIIATSTENLVGARDLEANKTTYNLPPVGTRVVIDDNIYTIINAQQAGLNQLYTLERNLKTEVSKGEEIRIEQDSVKVLCSLANLENKKDFKEMKLIKSKKLKGMFEGYVEEKYELEGEGRYSAIKLETERFNNNVESEIIELQQYFDYLED